MPLLEVEIEVADLNDYWRHGFGVQMSGADKAGAAAYLGVSVRSVQRWVTAAGQQRNPFPASLQETDWQDWPEAYQVRREFTRRLAIGGENEEQECANPAEFHRLAISAAGANLWCRDLEDEVIDPWLTEAWCSYTVERTKEGWDIVVIYDTTVSPKSEEDEEG